MVFFSTIIPVFNRADLIQKTLESVFRQEFLDQEIIVVDDGSTDRTLEELTKYGDRIKILRQNNKGPGEARNLGICHAQGEYIVFLDSDDLWFPWTLSTYKKVIIENNYPAFIAGIPTQFQNETEIESVQQSLLSIEIFTDYFASSNQSLWIQPGAVAIKADILRSVGGFTNLWINGEDCDLWAKLGTAKGFTYIRSPAIYAYRQHKNSAIANFDKSYQGMLYLIQQEKTRKYPGDKERQQERWEILTRHIRPVSLACCNEGYSQKGWRLYGETLTWHVALGRTRYLLSFPLIFALSSFSFKNTLNKCLNR